jgi:hypothetical protein
MPNAQTMQLSRARRRLAEPPDAGFGEAVSATPTVSDPAELELALRSLLSLHPQASISAVRADGVFVPTPEALADGHAVLTGGFRLGARPSPGSRGGDRRLGAGQRGGSRSVPGPSRRRARTHGAVLCL